MATLSKTPLTVSRAFDIWSFGCVLSLAVTWILTGSEGLTDFAGMRREYDEMSAFHDGHDVSPAVTQWHRRLRGQIRSSDHYTNNILDLVEDRMLLNDPWRRITSEAMEEEMRFILSREPRTLDRVEKKYWIQAARGHQALDSSSRGSRYETTYTTTLEPQTYPGVTGKSPALLAPISTSSSTQLRTSPHASGQFLTINEAKRLYARPSSSSFFKLRKPKRDNYLSKFLYDSDIVGLS
jgi:small nuclear ribonucleoprotein (snRNP)-like protein